jgi:2-methylcitrate dehydratase PrpD
VVQAIVDGKVTPESYSEAQLNRPDIQQLLAKTRLDMVHDIPADFTKMEVRVKLSDGRASVSDRWPGHWKLPATNEQIQRKFIRCASYMYPKETAGQLFDCLSASTNQINIIQLTALLRERL